MPMPSRLVAALTAACALFLAAPPVTAAATAQGALRPVRVTPIQEPRGASPGQLGLTAALTGPGSRDTVTVRVDGSGDGTLVVSAGERSLLTVPHVGGVGLLWFAGHNPVLVTASDQSGCGSGGCDYVGYTWVQAAQRMEAVGGAVGLTAPRYALRGGRFVPVGPPATTFWGFVSLNARGLALGERTYDAMQHFALQQYVYVPAPAGAGRWQAAGAPTYQPDRPLPESYPGAGTALGVATQFLIAVCMGLPVEAASAAATPAAGRSLYASARRALGPCGYPAVQVVKATAAGTAAVGLELTVWSQGVGASLYAYRVGLRLQAHGRHAVSALLGHGAIALRYRTPPAVLAAAARSAKVRALFARHPGLSLEEPYPAGPES